MRIVPAVLLAALVCLPATGSAQPTAPDREGSAGVRLHIGMWTTHLARLGRGFDANWLLAAGWRGLYGGTFINSFGRRAFAAGIERSLVRSEQGGLAGGLGYRLGLVTGYDERLLGLAAKVPVLPALQVMGNVAVGRTGIEVAWAGKVATVSPFMRVTR